MKNNSFAAAVSKASWKIIYLQLRSRHGRLRVCGRPVPDPSLSCRLGQPGRSEPLRVTADAAAFLRRGTLYCTHIRCQCRRRRGRLAAGPFLSCGRPLSRLRATSSRCTAQPAGTVRRPPARRGPHPRRPPETKRMGRVFTSLRCETADLVLFHTARRTAPGPTPGSPASGRHKRERNAAAVKGCGAALDAPRRMPRMLGCSSRSGADGELRWRSAAICEKAGEGHEGTEASRAGSEGDPT